MTSTEQCDWFIQWRYHQKNTLQPVYSRLLHLIQSGLDIYLYTSEVPFCDSYVIHTAVPGTCDTLVPGMISVTWYSTGISLSSSPCLNACHKYAYAHCKYAYKYLGDWYVIPGINIRVVPGTSCTWYHIITMAGFILDLHIVGARRLHI